MNSDIINLATVVKDQSIAKLVYCLYREDGLHSENVPLVPIAIHITLSFPLLCICPILPSPIVFTFSLPPFSCLQLFGMDFDALRKMCLGCPEDLWLLMCRCCQVCWYNQGPLGTHNSVTLFVSRTRKMGVSNCWTGI